jgi:hypothetical protein
MLGPKRNFESSISNGGKRRLSRIRRFEAPPVFGWKIFEKANSPSQTFASVFSVFGYLAE